MFLQETGVPANKKVCQQREKFVSVRKKPQKKKARLSKPTEEESEALAVQMLLGHTQKYLVTTFI